MSKITELNAENAKLIGTAVLNKIKELEELLGVEFSAGGGKFNGTTLDLKLTVALQSKITETGLNANELKYARNLELYDGYGGFNGIKSNCIGKDVDILGESMIVVGLSSTRSNAKFIIRSKQNGQLYKIDSDRVVSGIDPKYL